MKWFPSLPLYLLTLLVAAATLAACSNRDKADTADAEAAVVFTIGEPVADSSIALIVNVEGRADTLSTPMFLQQYYQTLQQNPFLAGDSLQAREIRRSIAESYVYQSVLGALARRETGLTVDTAQADAYIGALRQQAEQANMSFEAELAQAGMTADSLRQLLITQLRMQAMAERLAERAAAPTGAEIDTYRQEQAEEVRLQHIMFITRGLIPAQQDSIRRRAEAVLDSVKRGVDFADLARRNSQDGSAATGGDLDYVSRSSGLPEKLSDAAFALRDSGDVAPGLVKSEVGYHILRLTGRRTGVPMDTSQARTMLLNKRKTDVVETAIKESIRTLGVTVRVNPSVLEADINSPLNTDD